MTEVKRLLELHPTLKRENIEHYRDHRNKYRRLNPSPSPHAPCNECPMFGDCPLRWYIEPCVFGAIARRRVE